MENQTQRSDLLGFPLAAQWNYGNISHHIPLENLQMDSNMIWLLCSLISSICWVIYITFYNSRLVGYFITKLVNRIYIKGAYFKIGSLNVNPLAGKIMFRDIVYICYDYSVRIEDGYFIFRWWRSYVPKDVSEDLSHSDTRLSVMLNGFELHVYNRSNLYAEIEELFGLKPSILVTSENISAEELAKMKEQLMNMENDRKNSSTMYINKNDKKKARSEAMTATTWRDLIPVIKFDICSGRFVFGNRLIPNTLSINVEEAHCVYSTKPAMSRLDHFMHIFKAKIENAKVLLAPSPKYTGLVDDPPRYMGEGFVVMMSNLVEMYYYMDEPGIVPEQPVLLTLANGDVVEAFPPVWGIDIKCGKGTDFSYGPWADRQRDHLFKFFFPSDWQTLTVTQPPQPGEKRQYQSFDLSLSTLNEAQIDVLFSKNKETNAMHVTIGAGSYLEVTLPWITLQDGFTTKISGQLLHVEATTSLQYRSLAKCETLEFKVRVDYPLKWNEHQEWSFNLTGCKATAYLVYSHKHFFQDLIEDWGSKARPDILTFIPYTWKFCILLKEFEILTLSNEYNWIDCSSTNQENHHLAFCGDLFDLSFNLPFDDFLPQTITLKFWIHGEGLDLSLYLPEVSTSRPIVLALDENMKILTRDGQVKKRSEMLSKKWRKECQHSYGWIDCWSVPIVALSIQYTYHPMPPLGPDPQADITTPEKEEILLSPMRIPKLKMPSLNWTQVDYQRFDPTTLPSDKVSIEIEIGSSVLIAYGSVLRNFIHLKENIFGEDQVFTDMATYNSKPNILQTPANVNKTPNILLKEEQPTKSISETSIPTEEKPKHIDFRLYRPLEVIVSLTIHDIQAHLVKNCNDNDPPCPIVLIERLGFEMRKKFHETELQILVSPSFLLSMDNVVRPTKDKHLKQGHLLLSAVQVRGHAMFSNAGRSLNEETLEYAWLLEVQLGKLSGKLTLPQLCHLVTGLETFLMLTIDSENQLRTPKILRSCHHGIPVNQCQETIADSKYRCPSSEDIKYRMTRIAIDVIDIYLIESGTALHTWISPIRISTCNLHGQKVKSGVNGLISTILIRHFVCPSGHFSQSNYGVNNSHSNTNTIGSSRSARISHQQSFKIDNKSKSTLINDPGGGGGGSSSNNNIKPKTEYYSNNTGSYRRSESVNNRKSKAVDPMNMAGASGSGNMNRKSLDSDMGIGKRKEEYFYHQHQSQPQQGQQHQQHPQQQSSSIYASFNRDKFNREYECIETWLEVGYVSLGPIIIEAVTTLAINEHCLNLVQHHYLKLHDKLTKRLWFLWTNGAEVRCGCMGGCAFFGSNKNGMHFFKPSPQDVQDSINIARYHIYNNSKEYGFGQSLLHEGQLVFHTPPYSLQSVSLQECYENIEKSYFRISRQYDKDTKSPVPPKFTDTFIHDQQKELHCNTSGANNNNNNTANNSENCDRQQQQQQQQPIYQRMKSRENLPQSPVDRKSKFGYIQHGRPPVTAQQHGVPYTRLIDTSPRIHGAKEAELILATTELDPAGLASATSSAGRQDLNSILLTPRSLRLSITKSGAFMESKISEELSRSLDSQPGNPLESDSDQSLSPKVNIPSSDDTFEREVQRTISLTSENPSEIFFSADEDNISKSYSPKASDIILISPKKRFSSDLSIGDPNMMEHKLTTHRSDYEIHTPEHRNAFIRPQHSIDLDDKRRIHGLATPLRKISNISPRPEFRHFKPILDSESQDSSSGSPSLSSNSFISAMSSQEDITLVNLHMQVNRPIVDSPLLMASYVAHLAQIRCPNWSTCCMPLGADAFSTPLFQQTDDGGLVYIGSRYVPNFDTYSNRREIKIVSRIESKMTTSNSTGGSNHYSQLIPKSHPTMPTIIAEDDEFNNSQNDMATRNSIIVRFKGNIDVMMTPLFLEGFQRMLENVIPTLSTLHPLTIVNHFHGYCTRKVESVNVLKADQTLGYWSQTHTNWTRSTADRNLQEQVESGAIKSDIYEETLTTKLQGFIVLQRINLSMIQSSVVEEVISFSALDNVQDLSCASLLAVSFEDISTRFYFGQTTKASILSVHTQPTLRSSNLKKGRILRGTRALLAHLSSDTRSDHIPGEAILLETSEKQEEEFVLTVDISKTHAQLRRLKNSETIPIQTETSQQASSTSSSAAAAAAAAATGSPSSSSSSQTIVTAIPFYKSRAMFDCYKCCNDDDANDATIGLIMFECGLEGTEIKIIKKSQFRNTDNSDIKLNPADVSNTENIPNNTNTNNNNNNNSNSNNNNNNISSNNDNNNNDNIITIENNSKLENNIDCIDSITINICDNDNGELNQLDNNNSNAVPETSTKYEITTSKRKSGNQSQLLTGPSINHPSTNTITTTNTAATTKDKPFSGTLEKLKETKDKITQNKDKLKSLKTNNIQDPDEKEYIIGTANVSQSSVTSSTTATANANASATSAASAAGSGNISAGGNQYFTNSDGGIGGGNSSTTHQQTNSTHSDDGKNNGHISSCVIDLKIVWFNFAAPPRVPITKKIDLTRLDWNLLSTASPAITAWMNPTNRFAIKLVALLKAMHLRRTAVAACLMAEGLEAQGIQKHPKSRYAGKFTPLSKTIQEDPSCQLCTMMQKLTTKETVKKIENYLKQSDLPQLNVLRQGVIVLSRQWKNMLYNPMLFDYQYKNRLARPINVTFTVPTSDEDCEDDMEQNDYTLGVIDNQPLIDTHHVMNSSDSNDHEPTVMLRRGASEHKDYEVLDGSVSNCSSSITVDGKPWSNNQPATEPTTASMKEDLYSWMAKEHKENRKQFTKEKPHQQQQQQHSRRSRPTTTTTTHDLIKESTPLRLQFGNSVNNYNMPNSVRLLDAHLIFEPILTCLGVMPKQLINNLVNPEISSLNSLGTNLSLVGSFDILRIDIVVSESGDKFIRNRTNRKGNRKCMLTMPDETPSFLCERVGVELEVVTITDGFPEEFKSNMLYMSRGQLKRSTNTVINFSLNMRHISQQVNMPLLRLLHQISNMYQNVKEAQNELREQPGGGGGGSGGVGKRTFPLKDESSLASEIIDPLVDSVNNIPFSKLDDAFIEERYDHFNETFYGNNNSSNNNNNMTASMRRTRMPSLGPLIPLTPSPSARSRPQSFAQKLKSTSKSVKGKLGYTNLNESATTPLTKSPTFGYDHEFQFPNRTSDYKNSPIDLSKSFGYNSLNKPKTNSSASGITLSNMPKCWKTMLHLLDLYATMPETKTVAQRISISPDTILPKTTKKYIALKESKSIQPCDDERECTGTPVALIKYVDTQERTRLVVFGVVKIHKTRLLATLSGLKLEAEISGLHSSATWRKKCRPSSLECSLTGQLGSAMIVLLEGVLPAQQTVVKVTIGKSQNLYSSITKRGKDKNSGLLSIGPVNVDIPQHPVALHGMMTRSSKQISSTLQELRVTRASARLSRQNEERQSPMTANKTAKEKDSHSKTQSNDASFNNNTNNNSKFNSTQRSRSRLLKPLVMQFNILLQSLSVTAALLPSLQAKYRMEQISSVGVSGSKAKFTIDLRTHSLSFTTKINVSEEANLPSEACIALPQIHVSAEYIPDNASQDVPIAGVILRQGGYVAASAEIGDFERCLTTDLLNHLVFVQKVFMREINEIVQKVYGAEKPVPLWSEENEENSSPLKRLLFSLNIRVKRIQLTATTPCSSAVRFETEALDLHLSNRVKNIADGSNTNKLFGKAQIDLILSLGQIIRNVMFDEAEPEFQQYAFFNTTIGIRNAFQDEMLNDDKELVLITLKRPLIYIQPVAVDKAILVWLNYKNAYEYWSEKRANLNKEVLAATQQVFEKMPFGQFGHHLSGNNLSTLFLQLTVEDMGICLPLNPLPLASWTSRPYPEFESRGAVVITLENTIISACNSGSLVSKGKFFGLCLRFADDFEATLDDWKPNMNDSNIMNLCVVSEGTYEVCSRTIAAKNFENAKWFLNVKWQMEGVDIHLDINIGKQLSALGHTLTTLTGFEEEEATTLESPDSDDGDQVDKSSKENVTQKSKKKDLEKFPAFVFDPSIDPKKRSILMDKEITEQTKIINDLRTLGASHSTIAHEEQRLQELQAIYYKYFRRDMIQKWRKPSKRRSVMRSTNRSHSFVVSSPSNESEIDNTRDDNSIDTIFSNDGGSLQNSPPHFGPTRSTSLKVRALPFQRVSFTESMRQSSLPSADSKASFNTHDCGGGGGSTATSGSYNGNQRYDWTNYDDAELAEMNFVEVDGEPVQLRKKSPIHPQKTQEPNIDFELDIKVLVNSGKCVLHTKDLNDEKINVSNSSSNSRHHHHHHKRERSIGTMDWGSPLPSRRNRDKTNRMRHNVLTTVLVDLTIFHIPGLDVKLHYESKTVHDTMMGLTGMDNASPRLSTIIGNETGPNSMMTMRRTIGTKRASLFAWMILQSIPEETIISPHILEFLEQTLEPIPFKTDDVYLATATATTGGTNTAATATTAAAAAATTTNNTNPVNIDLFQSNNYVTYSSFPVDVIVYFHMQPSTFRFSCLPVSRVECMLQLPSLDIVFSSKRQDDEINNTGMHANMGNASTTNNSTPNTLIDQTSVGGLSVTGCLADFNIYIFHPYGGKKAGLKEAQFSPLADSERKDSLSINVEFVKFHLTRSRKINFETFSSYKTPTAEQSRAVIRFSTIVDIGSASFKYDMRRLTEILAFPKAWYRRRIVRRLFLGDLSVPQTSTGDIDNSSIKLDGRKPMVEVHQSTATSTTATGNNSDRNSSVLSASVGSNGSNTTNRDKLILNFDDGNVDDDQDDDGGGGGCGSNTLKSRDELKDSEKSSTLESNISPSETNQITAWETLVLFAFNFTKLNVQMNMGNVMGNVVWLTKGFKSDGRLSIGSTGHNNMHIGIGLGGSTLDAKGGIVGGTFELNKINTHIHIREEPLVEPHHTIGIKLLALELRLDYMGTSVLMTRISSLNATLRDEWICPAQSPQFQQQYNNNHNQHPNHRDSNNDSRRQTVILIHGDLSFDQLQMMISKSTTADLLKMFYKLEEFFSQQFKSSKRIFSNLETRSTTRSFNSMKRKQKKISNATDKMIAANVAKDWNTRDARHHRHWQKPFQQALGLTLSSMGGMSILKPESILGGTMEFHGRNISLACFHGINFKSKSWALFSLKDPCINFATEAQRSKVISDIHIIQTLTFGLGVNAKNQIQNHSMATVCRITRNIIFPPQFKSLHEWFHYAFANSEIDEINRFPTLERDKDTNTNSIERVRRQTNVSHSNTKLQDHNHNREVVFALPSLRLHFKTEHFQGQTTPDLSDDKPVVTCSFITEFEDHIFVTVDADAFFFLHDLITSYLKEKEKVVGSQNTRSASPNPMATGQNNTNRDSKTSFNGVDEFSLTSTSSGYSESGSGVTGSNNGGNTIGSTSINDNLRSTLGGGNRNLNESEKMDLEAFMKDWRRFECTTWHLEPTVRLLSWAGKSIEPYGIDYILNKLGFSHARTTIPKWLQRGFMDPLDKLETLLIMQLLYLVKEDRNHDKN